MKDVLVLNINGDNLNPTYRKRAKGLVKKMRATWVDSDTICLNEYALSFSEERKNNMDNKIFNYIKDQIEFLKSNIKDSKNGDLSGFSNAVAARENNKILSEIIILLNKLLDLSIEESKKTKS